MMHLSPNEAGVFIFIQNLQNLNIHLQYLYIGLKQPLHKEFMINL